MDIIFINALVSVLASYGIKSTFEVDLKANLLPKLMLVTIIDIVLFSILVFYIFEKINKNEEYFKYIIPFNWLQATQAMIMLGFTFWFVFTSLYFYFFWIWASNMDNFFIVENWQRRNWPFRLGSSWYNSFISNNLKQVLDYFQDIFQSYLFNRK